MRPLLNNWTVGRSLRLIVGVAALVAATLQKDPVYGLLAVFLLGTAAANIRCGGARCSVPSKTISTQKHHYEELDPKK